MSANRSSALPARVLTLKKGAFPLAECEKKITNSIKDLILKTNQGRMTYTCCSGLVVVKITSNFQALSLNGAHSACIVYIT